MTTIKASCPGCGEVSLTAADIVLRIGPAAMRSTYAFDCPKCDDSIEKQADERVIRLLLSGGVMPVIDHVPAEALESHDGPPISYDDILQFHEMLRTDGWFEELLRRT